MNKDNCPFKDDKDISCQYCIYGLQLIPDDEQEYAMYHGGYYEFFETECTYKGEDEDEQ